MDRLRTLTYLFLTLCLAISLHGCGGKSDTKSGATAYANQDSILKYIPADTPYVFAAAEEMPEDVQAKMKPFYSEAVLKMIRQSLLDTTADLSEKMEAEGKDDAEVQKSRAFMQEFADMLTPEGLEDTGFKFSARSALYGIGLIPVVRIEVEDVAKVEATIAKFEAKAGEKMSVASVGDQSYRYAGNEQVRVLVATIDGYFIASVVPSNLSEASVKAVLGVDLPKQNVASAGDLGELADTYGFSPYMAGFFDVTRLVATFIDDQSGINAEILKITEYDNSQLSNVCRDEIRALSGVMPRIVFGYNEVTTSILRSKAVFEMRDDIARGLADLSAPVPGLGQDHGGLMSFGFGMDLLAARKFYEARLDAMEADPFECEFFADLQGGVANGRAALEQPVPPIVYGIKGFLAVIDNVEGMDLATQKPPTDIDMSLLIATDNAAGLLAMGAFVSPELAALEIKPDGKPVDFALPPMGQPFTSAKLAMTDGALGIAVGKDADTRLASLVGSDETAAAPLMSLSMDMARYYQFTADMMELTAGMNLDDDGNPTSPMSEDSMKAYSDGMAQFAELFERMSYDIVFTEQGVEMPSVITLAD